MISPHLKKNAHLHAISEDGQKHNHFGSPAVLIGNALAKLRTGHFASSPYGDFALIGWFVNY